MKQWKRISSLRLAGRILYIAALVLVPGSLIVLPVLWWMEHHSHQHEGIASPRQTKMPELE